MMTPEEKQVFKEALDLVEELKIKLKEKASEKAIRTLLEEINKGFIGALNTINADLREAIKGLLNVASKSVLDKEELLKSIKNIKIEPKVNVQIPDIKVPKIENPSIKIPPIIVPKPEVTVNVPPLNIPKETKVKGLANFIKTIKGVFKVDTGHHRDNPMPVILVDEKSNFYKAVGGAMAIGGSPGNRKVIGSILTEDIKILTNKNQQYTYELPDGVKALSFHLRSGSYALQYSFQALSEGKFRTLEAGVPYNRENIELEGKKTLYLRCVDAAGEIIEFEIWT